MASLNKLSIFGFLALLAVTLADLDTEEALERIKSISPVRITVKIHIKSQFIYYNRAPLVITNATYNFTAN